MQGFKKSEWPVQNVILAFQRINLGRREGKVQVRDYDTPVTVEMERKGWIWKTCSRKNFEALLVDGLVGGLNQRWIPISFRVGRSRGSTISPISVDDTKNWVRVYNFTLISVQLKLELPMTVPTAKTLLDPDLVIWYIPILLATALDISFMQTLSKKVTEKTDGPLSPQCWDNHVHLSSHKRVLCIETG